MTEQEIRDLIHENQMSKMASQHELAYKNLKSMLNMLFIFILLELMMFAFNPFPVRNNNSIFASIVNWLRFVMFVYIMVMVLSEPNY